MLGKKWLLIISFLGLVVLIVVTWPNNKIKIIFCDVGQGDGMVVIKNNFQLMIDTGPDNKRMLTCLSKYLPFWDKTIEAVVVTHNDSDHSGGLASIRKYYRIDEQNIYAGNLRENDMLRYENISFETLSSDCSGCEDNDGSVVGILRTDELNVLMMGDASSALEQKLVWRKRLNNKISILKVSHHGSNTATSEELLKSIRPDEAVISVGKQNKFGHPTKEVLDRLVAAGVKVKRTDLEGDIIY